MRDVGPTKFFSNDDPELTLTYLTSRSNLLPNDFKWGNFLKVDFLKTIEAKVIILTWYVLSKVTMDINQFQRSRLTFQPRPLILELNIFFSETIGPIELKFHMKTPYNKLAKIYTNSFGHMADMPIYGKKPLKIFFSRTRRLMTLGLCI